jgi:hypothetical protein
MNDKLLGLLRKQEWLLRDRFERWSDENQPDRDKGQSPTHSREDMVDAELAMLAAQIELAREEDEPDDSEEGEV